MKFIGLILLLLNTVDGLKPCTDGQFGQENGKCCLPVQVSEGYGYNACQEDGKKDTVFKCSPGMEQKDSVPSYFRPTCHPKSCHSAHTKLETVKRNGEDVSLCFCKMEDNYCGTEETHRQPNSTLDVCEYIPNLQPSCTDGTIQQDCSCSLTHTSPTSAVKAKDKKSISEVSNPSTSSLNPRPAGNFDQDGDQIPSRKEDDGLLEQEHTDSPGSRENPEIHQNYITTLALAILIVAGSIVVLIIGSIVYFCYLRRRRKRMNRQRTPSTEGNDIELEEDLERQPEEEVQDPLLPQGRHRPQPVAVVTHIELEGLERQPEEEVQDPLLPQGLHRPQPVAVVTPIVRVRGEVQQEHTMMEFFDDNLDSR